MDEYETLDEYSELFHHNDDHKTKNKVAQCKSKFERHDICSQNHSLAEIAAGEKEMLQIRIEWLQSSKDEDPVEADQTTRFGKSKDGTANVGDTFQDEQKQKLFALFFRQ